MTNKFKKSHILMIFLILLFGLVFFFWFDYKNNLIAIWGDAMIPLNPEANLKYLNSWVDNNNGVMVLSSLHPVFLFYLLLKKIGLSLVFSQFLHVYLIHVGGALGMYYLACVIFRNHIYKNLLALTSAVLYMFSPALYNMYLAYSPFMVAPLILALFIDGSNKIRNWYIYAILIGIVFGVGGLPDPHPRPFVIIMALIILYVLFELMITRKIVKILSYLCLVVFITLFVNAWFFLRFFHNLSNFSYLNSTVEKVSISYSEKFLDEGTAMVDQMIRLFHSGLNMTSDKAIEYLSNSFVVLANYLYPILAFGAIFFIRKKDEINTKILYFLFSAIFFITFAKGPNPPFADFYKWLLMNVSFFRIFRTTAYIILGAAVAYSILIPFSVAAISQRIKNRFGRAVFLLFFIFVMSVNSYPFLLGYFTYAPGSIIPADTSKRGFPIPKSYYEMDKWLEKNSILETNVIALPLSLGYEPTIWGYYGIQMAPWVINKPVIVTQLSAFGSKINVLQNIIMDEIEYGITGSKMFVVMSGAKYIIVKNDSYDAKSMRMNSRIKNFYPFVVSFGDWYLYKTDSQHFLPIIYSPQNTILTGMEIDDFPQIRNDPGYKVRSVFIFGKQNENKNIGIIKNNKQDIDDLPTVEFRKINPTKYRINVHNAKDIFPLVFSETFHDEWKIFLGDGYKDPQPSLKDNFPALLNNYQVLDGNEEDQADRKEVQKFMDKGWISALGKDEKGTSFISKNFQGTIQNNNLSDGTFYETWFKKPLVSEDMHFIANSYANSWMINPNNFCPDNKYCQRNPDGSYDFNLVLEFWPQRLYYIGIGISGLTVLSGLLFFAVSFVFRQRQN